jgi:hypothetical protein
MAAGDFFPSSYELARQGFLEQVEGLRHRWPASRLESHVLRDFPDLSIDWVWAQPARREKILILTTGQHGIEGFTGSAMMRLFIEELAPHLRSEDTGLLLVHAINPWGMQNFRKVTSNNVDLNRNFVLDGQFDPSLNPDYQKLQNLLNPRRPVDSFAFERISFWSRAVQAIRRYGVKAVSRAALLGQHHTPQGFFYGGQAYEENTALLMALYRKALQEYERITHLDIHTGYGPRNQMSIIIPPVDPISSAEASRKFGYPLVRKINAQEFYSIHGDMQEYYYRLRDAEFPARQLLACGFEFGTFGASLASGIRSLRAMVLENQAHWHGVKNEAASRAVRREFRELYIPESPAWRNKAVQDARRAFEGILKAQELLPL